MAKVKISDRLMDEFKNDEKVTFLIKFDEKADVKKVAADVVSSAGKAKLSAHKTELMKRSAVVSELKATALTSQQSVKDFLNKEVKNGNAENVISYHIVNGMAVTATKEVAQKVAAFSEVEKILPNETRKLIKPVSDDSKTNAVTSADDAVEWNVDRIGASDVWATGIDGTGTVVASIDTGVQWDHPALKEKYRGYDAATGEVDHSFSWFDATAGESEPYDDNGHGTHTIGTMVGDEPDESNQIGVAPGAKFISVKAFSGSGRATDADLLAAAEWILAPTDADGNVRVDLAPDVVNNSWGGGAGLDEWYRDMVIAWRAAGIFPVFSAGNTTLFNPGGPGSVATPANYPESFAVGATDKDDMIADFSLRGPSPYDEIKPDISAPGVGIRSSVPGSEYAGYSGTSMAGPAVSGVALLLSQVNASITVDDMEEVLKSTATARTDDEYPESPNHGYGYGIVNAYDAVISIKDQLGKIEGKVTKAGDEEAAGKDKATLHPTKNNLQPSSGVSAQISVLESGRSVNTNPKDGTYSLTHAAGEYTLQAEAYGFHSAEQSVTVQKDGTTEADFTLEELDHYTVGGTITDEVTGDPIENATVIIVEDANVTPVRTDENGHYEFEAYVGDYTLKVIAPGHYSKEVEVTIDEDISDMDVELEPFYGYPGGEIGYDDGTRVSTKVNSDAGNGYAVKMSLAEGEETAMVTGGKFLFSDDSGLEFQVEVYDASGPNGAPGRKIAGPIDATVAEDNEWMTVDLKDQGIVVEGDFYMVYMQSHDSGSSPWISLDDGNPFSERSWRLYKGEWVQFKESDPFIGNLMIRALVDYEVDSPVITSPVEDYLTGESEITVEGTASPTTTIQLMNNGEEAGSKEVGVDGKFALPIELTEGENTITAVSEVDGDPAKESEAVTVTLDTEAPELTIDTPKDGDKSNRETVTVEGTVDDDHLDFVEVNGQKATVEDGSYSKRILLENGDNEIKVVAQDEVGNKKTKSVMIDVKYNAPVLENVTPTEDKNLQTGQSVRIEFDSEPGLRATFMIHMPLTNMGVQIANATELPMMEMSDGHYVGYWTVPSGVKADGAVIEVKAVDDFGNETRKTADGKLFINVPNEDPVANFNFSNNVKRNVETTFNAGSSNDPDGDIVKYEWKFGKGKHAEKAKGETVKYTFDKPGNRQVTLTITDNNGATASITKKIKIHNK